MKTQSHMSSESGFVMVSAYLLITVLSILSLAFFSRYFLFVQNTERNVNRMTAFNMADTGIDSAMRQIELDTSYAGTGSFTALGTNGGFETEVCPPSCPAGIAAPPEPLKRFVRSVGSAPGDDVTARAYETRTIDAYVEMDTTAFDFAALGDDSLTINGSPLVDSYDSAIGAYGGANIGSEGDVASDGPITFVGNPTVNGDTIENPQFNCIPAATSLPSSGALRINGNRNHVLAAGTYHFDSITISGSASLILTGPETIYVDGVVSIAGNGIATSGNTPRNFMLYATGDEDINIAGTSAFYGAVYAPAAEIHYSGTQDFYGAAIGKVFRHSGTADLHYDTNLKDIVVPCTSVDLLSWRESTPVLQG